MDKKRQSRYAPDPDRFLRVDVQERDLEILEYLVENRFLKTNQIQALFFSSSPLIKGVRGLSSSACKLRMQKLWNNGYVKRVFAPVSFGSSEAVYCPTKKGVQLLIENRGFNGGDIRFKSKQNRVKVDKIQHELELNDLMIALIKALVARENLYLSSNYPNCKKTLDLQAMREILVFKRGSDTWDYVEDSKNEGKLISIRPDMIFTLNGTVHFLELDRGTMSLTRFRKKLRGYKEYFLNGAFNSLYEANEFIVLTTALAEERRNNLLEQAIAEGGNSRCWFAVFNEVIANPFGKVWIRGKEYKEMLEGLPESTRQRILKAHRKMERDELVRENVKRYSLLE